MNTLWPKPISTLSLNLLYGAVKDFNILATLGETNIKIGSVVGFPLGFEDSDSKKAEAITLIEKDVNYYILFIVMKRKETKKISKIIKSIDKDSILIVEKIKTINNIV